MRYQAWYQTAILALAAVLALAILARGAGSEGMRNRRRRGRGGKGRRGGRGRRGQGRKGETPPAAGASGGGGEWKSGQMTYYWASEPELGNGTGPMGTRDNRLVAMKSIALKGSLADANFGRRVEIEGMGSDFVVADKCLGGGCKDIDLFVGQNSGGHDGVRPIRYRFL